MVLRKPFVGPPDGLPPADLVVHDVTAGNGSRAAEGRRITVHYVSALFSSGEEFDASWDRGAPVSFRLGVGRVLPGWDRGLVGMRVGGRRRLIVPPHLAYGREGVEGVVLPGETLVFVMDLLCVCVDPRCGTTTTCLNGHVT